MWTFSAWRGIAVSIGVVLAFSGGLWLAAGSGESAETTLGPSYGVSLDLPSGWIGRIYDANRGTAPPIADLQVGSFGAASSLDLLKDADDVGTQAAEAMGPSDILILIWETLGSGGFDYVELTGSPQIGPQDLGTALEGFPSTHAVGRLFFSTQGRMFDLMVEFGTLSPDSAELDRANRVLRSLRIEPRM